MCHTALLDAKFHAFLLDIDDVVNFAHSFDSRPALPPPAAPTKRPVAAAGAARPEK